MDVTYTNTRSFTQVRVSISSLSFFPSYLRVFLFCPLFFSVSYLYTSGLCLSSSPTFLVPRPFVHCPVSTSRLPPLRFSLVSCILFLPESPHSGIGKVRNSLRSNPSVHLRLRRSSHCSRGTVKRHSCSVSDDRNTGPPRVVDRTRDRSWGYRDPLPR